jgi:hypothetical protein
MDQLFICVLQPTRSVRCVWLSGAWCTDAAELAQVKPFAVEAVQVSTGKLYLLNVCNLSVGSEVFNQLVHTLSWNIHYSMKAFVNGASAAAGRCMTALISCTPQCSNSFIPPCTVLQHTDVRLVLIMC